MWESPTIAVQCFLRATQILKPARLSLAASLLGIIGTLSMAVQGAASAPVASVARLLNVTDEAHLHVTGSSGALFSEEGSATGALPATVKVRFSVGATISGSFTIYPRGGGSISGRGSAHLHSTGAYASFGGSMTVNHGTGRYTHARGSGGFYGVLNRRNNALTIQTTGRLSY
jgi:hypothetical protein